MKASEGNGALRLKKERTPAEQARLDRELALAWRDKDYRCGSRLIKAGADPMSESAPLLALSAQERDFDRVIALARHRLPEMEQARLGMFLGIKVRHAFPQCVALSAHHPGALRALKAMLKAGVDPNKRWAWASDDASDTSTQLAMLYEASDALEALLAFGADPNEKNHWDNSLLHIAVHRGDARMARVLLAAGADTRAKNKDGETPADLIGELSEDYEPAMREAFAQAERRELERALAASSASGRSIRM